MNDNLSCCIDWLSFTFPVTYNLQECISILGFDITEFIFLDGGASGYSKRCRHSVHNIWFLWQGNENMGVHVDCSGSAVQYLIDAVNKDFISTPFGAGRLVDDFDISELRNFFLKLSPIVKFSRIDLAIDDTTGKYYNLEMLHEIGNDRNYISCFKQWREVFTKDTSDGSCLGYTIYLGSRESDFFIRIYDKYLEQKSKNVDVPFGSWVRWEMEIKHDNADMVAQKICEYCDFNKLVFDLLNRYIRIIDLKTNSRKCRCKNTELWDRFVGSVSRLRLKRNISDFDIIDKKKNWLLSSVSKSLAMCIGADGGDDKLIYDLLVQGQSKLTSNDRQIINNRLLL